MVCAVTEMLAVGCLWRKYCSITRCDSSRVVGLRVFEVFSITIRAFDEISDQINDIPDLDTWTKADLRQLAKDQDLGKRTRKHVQRGR